MNNQKIIQLITSIKGTDSFEELAQKLQFSGLKISASSLKKYVAKKNDTRFPSYETLEKLIGYGQHINVEVPTIDEIIADFKQKNAVTLRKYVAESRLSGFGSGNVFNIPVLGSVPAGIPVLSEENINGYLPLPRLFLEDPKTAFCLEVFGDSMVDVGIEDGDTVLVQQQNTAESGQTVIARIDGEVTCKRFYLTKDKIRLEPANSKYKALESQNVEIIGRVIRIFKKID
ncbi:LexA repressor [Peptococcaceae bacterium CEB3]|nr:LexA repressor [Peptococcaceae bacterium CEB3]